jgi:hypothetical protein
MFAFAADLKHENAGVAIYGSNVGNDGREVVWLDPVGVLRPPQGERGDWMRDVE